MLPTTIVIISFVFFLTISVVSRKTVWTGLINVCSKTFVDKMSDLTNKEILNAIFNPLLPHGEILCNEDLPNVEETDEDDTEVAKESKNLELEGVKLAETGNLDGAIQVFTQAIQVAPFRASGYNNRAQTLRLMGKIDDAKIDLNTAIDLSKGKGRSACQAYCQRGLIHLKNSSQDEAKADFENAAKLGSEFAKAQLVQMNPYAALCNKMLRQVFTKQQTGKDPTDVNEEVLS